MLILLVMLSFGFFILWEKIIHNTLTVSTGSILLAFFVAFIVTTFLFAFNFFLHLILLHHLQGHSPNHNYVADFF